MEEIIYTIVGFFIITFATTLGSAMVFVFKNDVSEKLNTVFLGFASGVMIAASIWSLIVPSMELSSNWGHFSFIPTSVGIILGGLFLVAIDKIVPHFHSGTNEEEGMHSTLKKHTKLFLAVVIHNIPEGLAVGFAFGAASANGSTAAYISALGLAIGLAIQNFPEGAVVSLPLKKEIGSKNKAFLYGMSSGLIEPISAIVGFFLSSILIDIQPWLLAFAAGSMLYVVAEDLIPDSHLGEHPHLGTWGFMIGFIIMMILDVALG